MSFDSKIGFLIAIPAGFEARPKFSLIGDFGLFFNPSTKVS
jgi:hypothetical protein